MALSGTVLSQFGENPRKIGVNQHGKAWEKCSTACRGATFLLSLGNNARDALQQREPTGGCASIEGSRSDGTMPVEREKSFVER
jgi:hypothetical protein